MNNTGFKFAVVQRTITFKNAASLGGFEKVGARFNMQPSYADEVVDGSDYLINASRFAAEHRAKPRVGNVMFFVKDTFTGEHVI